MLHSLTVYFLTDRDDRCWLWYAHRLVLVARDAAAAFADALLRAPLTELAEMADMAAANVWEMSRNTALSLPLGGAGDAAVLRQIIAEKSTE